LSGRSPRTIAIVATGPSRTGSTSFLSAGDAIEVVLRYHFQGLGYQKVTVNVHAFNEASIRLYDRLGFRQEGRLRRMTYTRGRYFDSLIFGLTSEEFRERHPVACWHGTG
jgi:Acetyltransferase (GNAT) domain